jgi:hypothetical protein
MNNMKLKDSWLYNNIKFFQRVNLFKNVSECYYLIFGYTLQYGMEGFPNSLRENWINDFHPFLWQRLKDMYYPEANYPLSADFATVIDMYVTDKQEGIDLFYKLLDEFVELNSKEE